MEPVVVRNPEIMSGEPTFRGTRVLVRTLFEYLEAGHDLEQVLEGFATVKHEMAIFELLATLAGRDAVTVVVVTHNLNLASRYADRLLLLDRGRAVAEGAPGDVLRREILEAVYHWPLAVLPHPGPGPDAGAPQVVPLAVSEV